MATEHLSFDFAPVFCIVARPIRHDSIDHVGSTILQQILPDLLHEQFADLANLAKDDGSDASCHQKAKDSGGLGDGVHSTLRDDGLVDQRRVPDDVLLPASQQLATGKSELAF
jgi:hypothetical protein